MNQQPLLAEVRGLIARDELEEALRVLRSALEHTPQLNEIILQSGRFQYIRQQIRLGTVSHADANLTQNQIRFGVLDLLNEIEADGRHIALPHDLAQNLVESVGDEWVLSLRQDLLDQGVSVKNQQAAIMEHYGWLIEVFMQKMLTKQEDGSERPPLLRISHMAEAFQCTLRYLCFVQLAQVFKSGDKVHLPITRAFLALSDKDHWAFDYLNLLVIAAETIPEEQQFMPEIADFVRKLTDTNSDIYQTALFLNENRRRFLQNELPDDEAQLSRLVDEYLTALVFWFRQLAFLAKYRLVSIKDINLNYRLGMARKFVHLYGELHGIYNASAQNAEDYGTREVQEFFTYNQSVLLFKGKNTDECLDKISDPTTYISLSPLVVDKSVLDGKEKQTPEIFYYIGSDAGAQQYGFAKIRNEWHANQQVGSNPNEFLQVRRQNNTQVKLNDLYKHIEIVFSPFKTAKTQ